MTETIRSNGRKYNTKENRNRFFFPTEYIKVENLLKQNQKHTARFLINTGARINESRFVKVEDCDLINKRITLKKTKCKAKKGETHGRVRIIPISSQFAAYLKKYIKDNQLSQESYLNILSTPAFNIGLKKACQKAELKNYADFSAHTFRKTLECWLMALGVDGLRLTAHIGHDIRTAAHHYVSPDVFTYEERKDIRIIIGDLYGSSEK